jgi:hypothetical protein
MFSIQTCSRDLVLGGREKAFMWKETPLGLALTWSFGALRILQTQGLKAAPTHTCTHTHTNIQRVEDGSGSLFVVGISAICIQKRKLWIVGMFPDCSFQRPDLASITDPPSFLADESLLPDL